MTYLDMILRVQSNNKFRFYNAINSVQPLDPQIGIEQTNADILSTKLNFGMLQYFAELLIMLDYVTYTPFGKRGTKYLEKHLINKMSVKEYKKKLIIRALNNIGVEVGETFNLRIDTFLDFLYSDKQDLNCIESVAATIRIISGVNDNLISKGEIVGLDERDDNMGKIIDNIVNYIKENNTKEIDLNDFLPKIDDEPLNEKEIEYFPIIDVE